MEKEGKSNTAKFLGRTEIFEYAGIAASLLVPAILIPAISVWIGKEITANYLENRHSRRAGGSSLLGKK